ncbi:hypothetical protein HHK36_003281 [Tetracentron sinense]|uniref:Uncharacterized protein n=1 Tax=Tetracentron sinense TaxID=13715 RepID=A0A834ZMX0_TETSI|nr:hypothetical protein HHK36_003281 [Tetracentron sinense]
MKRRRFESATICISIELLLFNFLHRLSAVSVVTANDMECVYKGKDIFWSSDYPGINFTATYPTGRFQIKAGKNMFITLNKPFRLHNASLLE